MIRPFNRSGEFAKRLLEWVRGKGPVLIVAHDNPDPDSLAAAYALRHLILLKAGVEATIAFGGVIGRGENRVMVRELEISAVPIDSLCLDDYQVVCMVDTQPGAGNNSFPVDREVHVVIDHHPLRDLTRKCMWMDVRVDYGASATILFEYLVAQDVYLGVKLATILFYAIKSETQDLGREWSSADREAYLHLIPLCNNEILFKITHPKVPAAYFSYFNRAIETSRTYGSLLVFNLFNIDNPDMVAEMADFLIRLEEVDTVLGMGYYIDREILSMRTLREDVVASDLIQKMVGELGSAGGHSRIAGGQIRPMEGSRSEQRRLESTLTRRLLEMLGIPRRRGNRVLR